MTFKITQNDFGHISGSIGHRKTKPLLFEALGPVESIGIGYKPVQPRESVEKPLRDICQRQSKLFKKNFRNRKYFSKLAQLSYSNKCVRNV